MKKALLYFILTAMSIIYACQPSTSSETDERQSRAQEIYQEAIEVHDEIMPEMDKIMRLKQMLNTRMDSLQQLDAAAYADTLQSMQSAVQDLEQADHAMMQWMRNMKKVPGTERSQTAYTEEINTTGASDTADLVQIQIEQKETIERVKVQMEESIRQAKMLLELPDRE